MVVKAADVPADISKEKKRINFFPKRRILNVMWA
jgi:hypothetical protein